ncbi:capsule polysaccharide export inner-membrane protein BexC [Magnetospirillum molischianum]|uniref:Capsule polysaccharide export inner-membrane protein BexC n=1 Tax=Magnetospirillum molischianum DSM 120 TaxID=1150626 RepID=H8FX11_MAGML|nr:capsule polysaccharide export inner-membrane protein BexC [Magnetospirillum molischianum]CCG42899.1 Capsule polysaccharide export inner-membrane protein BexC [Magnetospirillum molischianum DSM 120]
MILPLPTSSETSSILSSMTAALRRVNILFVSVVLLPTLLATLYYGAIASDVYISESRFIIRKPSQQSSSALGLLLKGSSFSQSQDDTYTVREYIMSRDALIELDKKLDLRRTFSSKDIDIFSRFAGIIPDDSFETLFKYYLKHIDVTIGADSSIITLETRAFNGQEAVFANELLLDLSEDLVNKLNERARKDLISFALREVINAQSKNKAAVVALANYRNRHGVIDPEKQSQIPMQQISRLQDELISAIAQRTQLQMLAKDNPQIPSMDKRIEILKNEIQKVSDQIAGGDYSLASKASDYQRLSLDKEFSEKLLAGALGTLEQAHNEALRKQLYLERIVEPNIPDKALEPKRIRSIVAVFLVGLMLWLILTMVTAGIKEHQD